MGVEDRFQNFEMASPRFLRKKIDLQQGSPSLGMVDPKRGQGTDEIMHVLGNKAAAELSKLLAPFQDFGQRAKRCLPQPHGIPPEAFHHCTLLQVFEQNETCKFGMLIMIIEAVAGKFMKRTAWFERIQIEIGFRLPDRAIGIRKDCEVKPLLVLKIIIDHALGAPGIGRDPLKPGAFHAEA